MKKLKHALDTAISASTTDDVDTFKEAIEYLLVAKGVVEVNGLVFERERKGTTIFKSVLSSCATACYGVLVEYQIIQVKEVYPSVYKDMAKTLPASNVASFVNAHFSVIMSNTSRPDMVLETLLSTQILSVEDCENLFRQQRGVLLSHQYEVLFVIANNIKVTQGELSISTLCAWMEILDLNEDDLLNERISLDLVINTINRENGSKSLSGALHLSELFAYITERQCVEALAFPSQGSPLERIASVINNAKGMHLDEVTESQLLYVLSGLRWVMKMNASEPFGTGAYRAMKRLLLTWLTTRDVDIVSWLSKQTELPSELKALCTEVGLWLVINSDVSKDALPALYALSPFMFRCALRSSDLWRAYENCEAVFAHELSQRKQMDSEYVLSLYAAMKSANEKDGIDDGRTALLSRYVEKLDWNTVDLIRGKKIVDLNDINQWRVCYETHPGGGYKGYILFLMLCRFGLARVAGKVKSKEMLDALLSLRSPLDVLAHIPDYNRRWKKELMLRMA